MKLALVHLSTAACPYRLFDDADQEIAWANDFLDAQHLRQLSPRSLRAYAYDLLDFARWFQSRPQALSEITESILLDYVRHQLSQQPRPTPQTVNHRLTVIRCVYRFHYGQEIPSGHSHFQRKWSTRCPLGYGRPHRAMAFGLRLRQPRRVIQPLTAEQVAKFWASFRTFRDLAVVGLMLLDGLRSCEILTLQLEDLRLADALLNVLGKGRKQRTLPLPGEILEVLQSYVRLERPLTNSPYLFVSLKGRRRGPAHDAGGTPLAVPTSSIAQRGPDRQSPPVPPHLRSGYGQGRHLPARAPTSDGPFADSHHSAVCPACAHRRLARVCPRSR